MARVGAWLAGMLLSLAPIVVSAHGGGLDSYGCHHNRKQGGYHCHRGEMAGQSFQSQQEMLETMRKDPKKAPKKKEK